jgi:predicted small secreted protein
MRLFLLLSTVLCVLSACNTMQGLGQDIESLGSGLNRSAGETKEKM